jgi:hypothetical protein
MCAARIIVDEYLVLNEVFASFGLAAGLDAE